MVEPVLLGVYGEVKTAKSSIGLTFPRPMVYINFDQGFHRAAWRFPHYKVEHLNNLDSMADIINRTNGQSDVYLRTYQLPFVWPGKKAQGYIQIYDNLLLHDFVALYSDPRIKSVVIDTGSLLWSFICDTHLERLNTFKPRENLLQYDYRRPNLDMRTIIGSARHYGKNLCVIHHVGGVYENRKQGKIDVSVKVGETWSGWKEMGGLVDIVGRTYKEEVVQGPNGALVTQKCMPYLVPEKCGLTLAAEGQRINDPTFDNIMAAINHYRQGVIT